MNLTIIKWFKKQKEQQQEQHVKEGDPKNPESVNGSLENYHTVIGKMSAFFAHEIRNPLTSIIGFTQFLDTHPTVKSDPNLAHYLSIIRDEATRMEALIQELLSLSTSYLDQDNLSIIDVKHSIEKIVTIYQMQESKKHILFKTDLEDDTYITGNSSRFERVIINLINNSIEAMSNEGIIEIQLKKDGKHVLLSLIDNGTGISPEQLEQIFYPFYTTKDEGTGLGLPICKTIIETMSGTLDIQNHSTKGVHVKIKLPQSRQVSHKS